PDVLSLTPFALLGVDPASVGGALGELKQVLRLLGVEALDLRAGLVGLGVVGALVVAHWLKKKAKEKRDKEIEAARPERPLWREPIDPATAVGQAATPTADPSGLCDPEAEFSHFSDFLAEESGGTASKPHDADVTVFAPAMVLPGEEVIIQV